MRAAVVLPALLVVLLAAPLSVAAAPEGELTCTAYVAWIPTGDLAFRPGADPRVEPRGLSPAGFSPSAGPQHLETRK
jgi:hypothetical protein